MTRLLLIAAATGLTILLFGLPLIAVFTEALRNGLAAIPAVLADPDASAAVGLTAWPPPGASPSTISAAARCW